MLSAIFLADTHNSIVSVSERFLYFFSHLVGQTKTCPGTNGLKTN